MNAAKLYKQVRREIPGLPDSKKVVVLLQNDEKCAFSLYEIHRLRRLGTRARLCERA